MGSRLLELLTCRRRSLAPAPAFDGFSVAAKVSPEELKSQGNEAFAQKDVAAGVALWAEARRRAAESAESSALLRSLDANLALGHLHLEDWASALACAEAALQMEAANGGSRDVKVLHRRALALAGLQRWADADRALDEFQAAGGGRSLASQTRRDWEKSRQKDPACPPERSCHSLQEGALGPEWKDDEGWAAPKVEWMSVFDVRTQSCDCGICWKEDADDFNDKVWTPDGLGGRQLEHYPTAVALTTLAAAALAKLRVPEEPTIHVLHAGSGDMAHDWKVFLDRCPNVKTLHVAYVGLPSYDDCNSSLHLRLPRGDLTEAVEEASAEGRVARISRFNGSYSEFLDVVSSNSIAELQSPWLALFNDVAVASGISLAEKRLDDVMNAVACLSAAGTPLAVTLPGNIKDRQLRVPAQRAMAAFRLLRLKQLVTWQWNRFCICRRMQGSGEGSSYVGAYAVVGVLVPSASKPWQALELLKGLDKRSVPQEEPDDEEAQDSNGPQGQSAKIKEMCDSEKFQKQFEAFKRKMEKEGRPTGADMTREEHHRQGIEFASWMHSCSRSEWETEAESLSKQPTIEEVEDDDPAAADA